MKIPKTLQKIYYLGDIPKVVLTAKTTLISVFTCKTDQEGKMKQISRCWNRALTFKVMILNHTSSSLTESPTFRSELKRGS